MLVANATLAVNVSMLEFAFLGGSNLQNLDLIQKGFARMFMVKIDGHRVLLESCDSSYQWFARFILGVKTRV